MCSFESNCCPICGLILLLDLPERTSLPIPFHDTGNESMHLRRQRNSGADVGADEPHRGRLHLLERVAPRRIAQTVEKSARVGVKLLGVAFDYQEVRVKYGG